MNYLLVLAAFLCSLAAWLTSYGKLHWGTWQEWIAAALIFYFLSLLVPWVETRRAA